MRDAESFERTAFLGLARGTKRDPYRLSLFAEHLTADEQPLALLPVQGSTLIVTDRRVLELRAHLEVHGAWNVKEFRGYAVHRAIERGAVRNVVRSVRTDLEAVRSQRIDDCLVVTTAEGPEEILVSRGPAPTLSEGDVAALRQAILGSQA